MILRAFSFYDCGLRLYFVKTIHKQKEGSTKYFTKIERKPQEIEIEGMRTSKRRNWGWYDQDKRELGVLSHDQVIPYQISRKISKRSKPDR